jgi:hypothetical protein
MKKVLFYGFMLLTMALALVTCNDDNSSGKIEITDEFIVKTKSFETYLHLDFVDAKTGEFLRGKKVTVSIGGKDAGAVYNNIGFNEESYTSESGIFDLVVDPSKASSDFVIKVGSPGYNDFTHHARLSESRFTIITVALVNLSDLPEGVSQSAPRVISVPAGGTTEAVSVPVNGSNAIAIPDGTVLKDAQGNVVTGEVESKILFFDPADAQEFFPGGLDVEAVRPDGSVADISFSSAGLFDIELTSGDTQVKTIEGEGVELTTLLDPSLINPNTGKPVAENDEIEMWSMDPETNVWQYEKTTVVKRNSRGLYLQEKVNHLSYWNWDWFTNSCYTGAKIKWIGNVAPYTMVTVTNKNPLNYYSNTFSTAIDVVEGSYYNTLQFNYVPANMPATLSFKGNGLTFEPEILTIPNLCDASKTYQVKVSQKDKTYYRLNLDVDLYSKSDPSRKFSIYGYAYFYPLGYYSGYQYAYISEGVLQTTLEADVDYELSLGVGNMYGWGYVSITDAGNNKLKVTITPEFAYNYNYNAYSYEYWNNIPKEEYIIDKPADNVVNIHASFAINEDALGGIL